MKPVLFLRIASVLTLIHAILHTIGGVFGAPSPGVATTVAAMMRSRFPVMGVMRSYSDFYLGLGLAVSIFLTAEAIGSGFLPHSPSPTPRDSGRSWPFLRLAIWRWR